MHPDTGAKLLNREDIQEALDEVFKHRLNAALVDADSLLYELWDNHNISRQQGSMSSSNRAIELMMKHKAINAFASDKLDVQVNMDKEVEQRLQRGRDRARRRNNPDEPSFL